MNLTTWIVLACSIAVAGTVGYFKWQNGRLATQLEAAALTIGVQQNQVEVAKAVADENIAAVERIRADLKRQEDIAAKAQAAERKRTAELNAAKKRIQNAPTDLDGPVAPILRNALDGLRTDSVQPPVGNPPPNSPDANPSGTTASEPVGPPLPGETPAT